MLDCGVNTNYGAGCTGSNDAVPNSDDELVCLDGIDMGIRGV